MRLIRFGTVGQERPGILNAKNQGLDISAFNEDYNEAFFGSDGIERLAHWLGTYENQCPVISDDVRLGPAICRPSKIVCVGLNYARHAKESGWIFPSSL